jgi:hypothetical protein
MFFPGLCRARARRRWRYGPGGLSCKCYERCAAVDVGKDVIAVAVRRPGRGRDGRVADKRTCKTFYGVLREMARWLAAEGVTHVAVEGSACIRCRPAMP